MRKSKGYLLSTCCNKESDHHLCFVRDSKSGRGAGKLCSGKKGRLQLCPDWEWLAWGSWGPTNQKGDILRDCLEVQIWLSLVGPKLETGTKIIEAVNYQVLTIWGQLVQKLLFSFLDCYQRQQSDLQQAGFLVCFIVDIRRLVSWAGCGSEFYFCMVRVHFYIQSLRSQQYIFLNKWPDTMLGFSHTTLCKLVMVTFILQIKKLRLEQFKSHSQLTHHKSQTRRKQHPECFGSQNKRDIVDYISLII